MIEALRGWKSRADHFSRTLSRRLPGTYRRHGWSQPGRAVSDEEIQHVEDEIGFALPDALRALFLAGLGGYRRRIGWQPTNEQDATQLAALMPHQKWLCLGPDFIALNVLPDATRCCRRWATPLDDDAPSRVRIASSVPFIVVPNGDFLALDLSDITSDPPVLQVNHEEQSQHIAPCLWAFLQTWEQLCYLGPESWMLEPFRGENGMLSGDTPAATELRQRLGVETR